MILVIFDIDGTLVHSKDQQDSKAFANAYQEEHKQTFPTIDWRKYPHVTDTVIYNTVFEQHFNRLPNEEERHQFEERYIGFLRNNRQSKPDHFFEVPGAKEMVTYLLETPGFEVAIATGGWKRPQMLKLDHIGIQTQDLPFSGADGKHTREDILREAVQLAAIKGDSFNRTVYIGDAIWDVVTTRNLNMNFLGIRHRKDFHVLEQAGAQHVLDNYINPSRFLMLLEDAVTPFTME